MIEHYIRGFEEDLREIRHQIHEKEPSACASGAMRLSKGWRQPAW